MLRRRLPLILLAAMLPLTAAAPAAHAAGPAVEGIAPAFGESVPDHTIGCPGNVATVAVTVPPGRTLMIDGRRLGPGSRRLQIALKPGQRFTLRFSGRWTRTHSVRCLPADFPTWTTTRSGTPQVQWLVFSQVLPPAGAYAIIADAHGVPVWWHNQPTTERIIDVKVLPDRTVAWTPTALSFFGEGTFARYALGGGRLPGITGVGYKADHHELIQERGGRYLVLVYRPRDHVDLTTIGGPVDATVLEGEVQEVTAAGRLLWSWSMHGHVALAERSSLSATAMLLHGRIVYDLDHLNAIELDGPDHLMISARHEHAVYRIRRSTGAIDWKLGGTRTSRSLKVLGDPLGADPFGGQHDVRLLPDGTITVHDNGTTRNRPPRAVRYRIDRARRTATLVEDVRDPRVTTSPGLGSARRLRGGHWVMSWGGRPFITELTPKGRPVLTLTLPNGASYRAQALEPGFLSAARLRAGMDAMHPRR
ncbi:unannotated protein [freshwater metagenome]|uniref:Unannotated protein n=1 Tax=freshwater metagenome TaxID=449393 RepID=A0A6J7EDF2_9ZZZZ|nr:hypothetical protein [Actinomycetota bacterium]